MLIRYLFDGTFQACRVPNVLLAIHQGATPFRNDASLSFFPFFIGLFSAI